LEIGGGRVRSSLSILFLLGAFSLTRGVQAEPADLPDEVAQAVRAGTPEVLATRFGETGQSNECHLLAQAYANKARRVTNATERAKACELSAEWYEKWISATERAARGDASPRAALEQAAARLEYGGMVMNLQSAGELDRFEITAGQQGDRGKLLAWLGTARIQCRRAGLLLEPLYDALGKREDEFLVAGIYDSIVQMKLNADFNDAWAGCYCALLDGHDEQARREALSNAELGFRSILESGRAGQMRGRCRLGMAIVQRELRRFGEAERNFAAALRANPAPLEAAQIRYEQARCHMAEGNFAEARTALRPLLELAAAEPSPERRAVQFYVNLARLWDANSYLLEARALESEAGGADPLSLRRRAQKVRATGLRKFEVMAARGGPWPALVQLYVAAGIDLNADPQRLSPAELLYTARQLASDGQLDQARQRLEAALARPEMKQLKPVQQAVGGSPAGSASDIADQRQVAGRLLFELAKCYYRLNRPVDSARTFDRLARELRSHELAPQAATFAYQLWAEIAQASRVRGDYERLADTLLNLVQHFPDHPQREQATWLLPVAWQAAGHYSAAADEFAKVPRASRYREEAQCRERICRRLALEQRRAELSPDELHKQARVLADELLRYAEQALGRASAAPGDADQIRNWSAEARVNAAELLVSEGLEDYRAALAALKKFEDTYGQKERMGRVLAVRIRALRGLKRFDEAARILGQYLDSVPADQSGPILNMLTRGMQEEVERLSQEGKQAAARRLATESLPAFEQLEGWARRDASRAAAIAPIALARAGMLYTAGELSDARALLSDVLRDDAQNGNAQRLLALVLTEQLPPTEATVDSAQLKAALEAWAALLKDPGLRQRSPERYWEARYNWLALLLRQGQAAEVEQAITQEQVWYPDLGGAEWREKLLKLQEQARAGSLQSSQAREP
jgi:hypothetical protein